MPQLIAIIFLLILFAYLWPVFVAVVLIYLLYRLIRYIRKTIYFKSTSFLNHKQEIDETINDYNEIAQYVSNLPKNNQFIAKKNYDHSHLAKTTNTSQHNYKRNRNSRNLESRNVYPASLNIVRKASEEPIKYLCKYFNIDATPENLKQIQAIGENISRIENAITNLKNRQKEIEKDFNPPKFILKHYHEELMNKIGINIPSMNIPYATYIFEYVSAGGNSSQKTTISFDLETIEALSQFLVQKIKFAKSAEGQRALMTNKLRENIKKRDNYTCQMCSASIYEQDLLLLEVDHIIPVSKGGLSTPENLQTLCWKCNRSKSNKILNT
ncbi:HNH endonuclease [Vagococcus sp. JNUCC 83]